MNSGINNGDGTWTVQTYDPSLLTVTTPADFSGAVVLGISMMWTNLDGSLGSTYVYDNVEAYAPGSPIFALSTDDNLTGSSGNDTFVFAQPIGNNVIYNFDVNQDKIDLIGFAGVIAFAGLAIANNAYGDAVITIGDNQTITVKGVDASALTANNFLFDVEPVVENPGIMSIDDGAILPLGGTIHNTGTIELNSTGQETDLEILFKGATLDGGGQVVMSDSDQNVIFGGTSDTLLLNVDNTISGAGQLGAGQMTLHNEGVINADGTQALVIDTGANTIVNSGTLEASGSGGLIINSDVTNTETGQLWAHGGNITANGAVNGGAALIDDAGSIEFGAAASTNVNFGDAADGSFNTLKLNDADQFNGTVTGLNADDVLDFSDIDFAGATLNYSDNGSGTGGTLTVTDGTDTANINLVGSYAANSFQLTMDASGGTLVMNNLPETP